MTPGAVKVTSSEQYGPIKIRRTMDLVLEADGDEYLVHEKNVKVTSVEGPLTQAQVEAVEKFAAPLKRRWRWTRGGGDGGVAARRGGLEKLKASLPADEVVRSLVELQLESMEQIDRLDERQITSGMRSSATGRGVTSRCCSRCGRSCRTVES